MPQRSTRSSISDPPSSSPVPPAPSDPLALTVRLTPQVHSLLAHLLATGFYGWTLEDAAARLIDRGLERAVAEGALRR
jgi:hypothetical protein